jgi:formate hydrogenlyase subunit 4
LQRFARLSVPGRDSDGGLPGADGFHRALNGAGDIILLIYLLTLCGICTLLGGLAAGSTYSLLGSGREMMTMIMLEPLFAIALLIGAVHVGSFRLDAVLNGSVYAVQGIPWSGLILLVVMVLSFQAFVQRMPFDIPRRKRKSWKGRWWNTPGRSWPCSNTRKW